MALRAAPCNGTDGNLWRLSVGIMEIPSHSPSFKQESAYNVAVPDWSTNGCSMRDFSDESAHEVWADEVADDAELEHVDEYPTHQEIVRQGLDLRYSEPRVKPNTLAGLLGLTMGSVFTVQDGSSGAYRHRLEPMHSLELPSIGAMSRHAQGLAYRYTGVKSDATAWSLPAVHTLRCAPHRFRLPGDQPEPFASAIIEPWLRVGDTHVYSL